MPSPPASPDLTGETVHPARVRAETATSQNRFETIGPLAQLTARQQIQVSRPRPLWSTTMAIH